MKLGEALRAAAQDAGMYADPARALHKARRRRRGRLVAGSACVAVLVIAAVWAAQLLPFKADRVPAAPPSSAGVAWKGEYPARVEAPSGAVPALPADRGVGPAAFIYSAGNGPLLVTTTGAQYALPAPDLFHAGLVSLSPDGRWLLDGDVLRDLTSATTHRVPRGTAQWSPNGRWLLIGTSGNNQLADTTTGKVTEVADAVGVLDTGQLLVAGNVESTRATITITGGKPHTITVDGAGVLGPREQLAVQNGENGFVLSRVWPYSADRALFEVQGAAHDQVLLDVSLTDGRILHRTVIPAWGVGGLDSGRLVLRRDPSAGAAPYQLAVIDPSGGTPAVVCTYPSNSVVLTRGGNRTL